MLHYIREIVGKSDWYQARDEKGKTGNERAWALVVEASTWTSHLEAKGEQLDKD